MGDTQYPDCLAFNAIDDAIVAVDEFPHVSSVKARDETAGLREQREVSDSADDPGDETGRPVRRDGEHEVAGRF